ncbi:MAG: DUF3179 domain-containing protein [Deltaproteobacteria bacterium]|nr:DUF3179 domain-containing protein [Deltaproteobacteria bacterium]
MYKKSLFFFIIIFIVICFVQPGITFSSVVKKGSKTFIVDRLGEHWNVTQAASIGFKPDRFQYGIGRNAFTTLDNSNLSRSTSLVSSNLRVIGVADDSEAHAYSVRKLTRHEIANITLGSKAIAVGY